MVAPLLATVLAQPAALQTLRRALSSGRVHHAYLFDGPNGIGKERTAFGLAQALVCERRAAGSADACGACGACARAVPRSVADETASSAAGSYSSEERRPAHSDVVVLERGLYEPTTIGRRTPETQDLSIDQVRTLVLSRSAYAPYEGKAKVFVVRRVEELSPPASNALLKTLEEPGKLTHFVLLTSSADALLPTIRSRTQRVRFGALPEATVAELLVARGMDATRATEIARLAGGSMATAFLLADPEEIGRRDAFVSRALAAIDARDFGAALDLAEEAKKGEKPALVDGLHALASRLAVEARAAAAVAGRRAEVASLRCGLAIAAVEEIEANASAQLAVEAMLLKMRRAG
jgi:DNA polymerase-3 subunit delta'